MPRSLSFLADRLGCGWMQGNQDPVFGTVVPQEHIKLFTSSPEAKLVFVEGGGHYLNATSPGEVEEAVVEMVSKYRGD